MRIKRSSLYEVVVEDALKLWDDEGRPIGWQSRMVPVTPHLESPPPPDMIEPIVLSGVAKEIYTRKIPSHFIGDAVSYSSEIADGKRPVRAVLRRVAELKLGEVAVHFPREVEDYLFANPNASR